MRDFLLNEALKRLATEAATRFSALVAGGDQIPFDVAAENGDDSAFYSYVPLTSRFVEERRGSCARCPASGPPARRPSRPASPPPTWRRAARPCPPTPASAPNGC